MPIVRRRSLVYCPFIFISVVLFFAHPAIVVADSQEKPARDLQVLRGDHLCIIGNTLADRMQHDGWLETLIHSRFPRHELVIRNLGFSGDELTVRLRSADFGEPDQHLSIHKTDIVLAFFGYNESFAGPEGLDRFKKDLGVFITHTLSQRYNGKSRPRLVLFSPIAHEDLHNRNLPDGKVNNRRLVLYTKAMAEVAGAHHVIFVDLFAPTQELYAAASAPLTINGIHFNEHGNQLVAQVIDKALFPHKPAPPRAPAAIEKLRQAVLDKNVYWFNRYRTVDGYSIFGGRADLAFTDGQTNRVVMRREMEVLDVMTANRDRRIWAVAQGRELAISDANTPPFIPVKTNKPGAGPNGTHLFLDPEESIRRMVTAKGIKINLFASEREFPEISKPVQMSFDTKGRLWVAVWPTYPHWKPKEEMNDKILILEDTDGDGKADKCTVFADHLHCPTGFEFYNGGVLVAQAPDVLFLKDTVGDGKAHLRQRVLSGIDSADTHHTANSFILDPGGALYFQEGTFHHTQVETPYGPPARCANAGVYRYEPRSQKFEVYVSYPFANPHGHVFDHWGQDFVTDGTGNVNYFAAAFSGHIDFPAKHSSLEPFFHQRTRPCPATEILSSRHFPPDMQGNYLDANVIGFQGILQYKIRDEGSGFAAQEMEPLVYSSDTNFRPSALQVGPDGALYFLDWQNPVIGHMQHNLRDPSRDRLHGRIYRVTAEGRPLLTPPAIAGEPIAKLLDLLKEPEDRVRYRAKIELGARPSAEVVAATEKWLAGLDKNDVNYEHQLLEALWVHQYHNVVNRDLLLTLTRSPDFRARAAATRVLCYWRDRVPDAIALLKTLAADPSPRVRLEAVRAASFFTVLEAVDIPLISAQYPSDYFLDYTRAETMKTLEPYWKKAMLEGRPISVDRAGARLLVHQLTMEDLTHLKRGDAVYWELLLRPGVREEFRLEALAGLAALEKKTADNVLLEAVRTYDAQTREREDSVVFDLMRLLSGRGATELTAMRAPLVQLATHGKLPVTRQLGFVALIAADGDVAKAWALGMKSVGGLEDLLKGVPLIRDPNLRASLYPKVEPLLFDLPKPLNGGDSEGTVRRAAIKALISMRGQEAPTVKGLIRLVREGKDRHAAIQGLQRIAVTNWPAEEIRPLLETILSFVRTIPVQSRTSPAAQDALQLADSLAATLPPREARPVRRELGELGVRVIRLGTVPDQMIYDKERLVVEAGKPVEIVFENNDLMPHNFVLVQPGGLEEVGLLAEASATQPGAQDRQYVPASNKIMVASRLLSPRDSQHLSFIAPKQPGVYPFVCTYPGHWRRMYGAMYAVDDIDQYLADAEAYLTRHPLKIADDLLKYNRPRKEWKVVDLAPSVEQLEHGRSYNNGKQMFQVANCGACHRLNNVGNEFGPDLAKLDVKTKAADILRDIVEPSFKINEKYYTYVFEMQSGKVITGIILEETAGVVKVIENPLAKSEPVVLKAADIAERKKSLTSMMPKGLLDKLTREEILDLIAYIAARGDARHRLFQDGHEHMHGSGH